MTALELLRFCVTRVGSALLTLLLVSVIVFASLQAVPGGYEDVVLGPLASPELRAQTAERYGLDDPIPVQYLRWLRGVVQGDLGVSLVSGQSVSGELGRRLPPTIELVTGAMLMSVLIGVPLGTVSGLAAGRPRTQAASRLFGAATISVPDFVVGTALVYLFSANALWFRVGSYVPVTEDLVGNVRSMGLPIFTLGLFGIAVIMRTQRDAVRSVMTQSYITSAVARGERPLQIVRRHVIRNSAIPLVTIVAVLVGAFISGSVIVETLFSIPGIGGLFVTSVRNRDFAIVQAAVLVSATVYVVSNMVADLLYAVLDPRVGSGRANST